MAIATFSTTALIANCDAVYPAVGTIGYLTLLSGDLQVGLGYTADATTDRLTTGAAHRRSREVGKPRFSKRGGTTTRAVLTAYKT